MKKLLVIVGVILSLNQVTHAQETKSGKEQPVLNVPIMVDESKSYIAAFFGMSLPADQFGQTTEKENSGFAKPGIKINVDGAYIIYQNVGLGATMGYFTNNVKADAYFNQFDVNTQITDADYTISPWKNAYLGLGPYFSLPEKKLFFEGRFLVGLAFTQSPDIHLKINPSIHRYSVNDWSLAYIGSLGIGLRVATQWRVVLQAEYFNANPEFEIKHDIKNNGIEIKTTNVYKQRVAHFGIGLGLQLDLIK